MVLLFPRKTQKRVSKIAADLYVVLKELYPFAKITPEHYVNFKNTRLLFDFYIRNMNLLFECQGRQHTEFVKHFHGIKENFYGQKRRDNLKVEYCENSGLTLVFFYDTIDKINKETVLKRIYEAMDV